MPDPGSGSNGLGYMPVAAVGNLIYTAGGSQYDPSGSILSDSPIAFSYDTVNDIVNDGAVPGFGHDDIDRGKQGFKREWKCLSGVNTGISRWDWAIEEKAIVAQLFHLIKREGRERNTAESHQYGPFVGR